VRTPEDGEYEFPILTNCDRLERYDCNQQSAVSVMPKSLKGMLRSLVCEIVSKAAERSSPATAVTEAASSADRRSSVSFTKAVSVEWCER